MVELQAPLPSSRLGGFHRMSDGGDGLVAVEPRAIGSAAWALDSGGRGGGGVDEATGVERRQSRVGSGHCGLNLPGEESGSAAWLQRSLTERPRVARQGAMERESVVERAHSERLMMVGAADKTEGRGGGWKSGPAAEAEDLRAGGGFQRKENLPGGMGSRRSMTMNEAKLIQPIGQAVVCMDIQGRITHWNRAAEVMYMWRTNEAVSRNFVELLSPIDLKEEWTGVLERVKASGVSWSGSFRAARKDGVILNILVTNTPIVDDEERIIGVVGISSEDVLQSTPGSIITRSHSSEGFMSEGEKQSPRQTGSAEGQTFWRRAQLEGENQARDEFPDDPSNAASGNLQKVKESMQQLLRSFQSGGKPPKKDLGAERREQSWKELGVDSTARSASHPFGGAVEASQVRTAAKESGDSHFREKWESAPAKLVLPAKPFTFGEGGSWENLTSQDTGKDALVNSLANPQMGTYNQSLSRSSSGSAPGSAAGRDLSSIGSPVDRSMLEGTWTPAAPGLNFQQAEEDFQLQSALALRVAAQAAAVEDPDLSSNLGSGANPGVDRMEATAYRYWVNCSLSYDDRIEDGFYEVWGMSPYVWGMCTDTSQLGRMPPLENLRAVSPNDATFEVLLVDRSQDTKLAELEDRAIELAYESTDDVMDMASALSILVAKVMGGAAASDERLAEDWLANKKRHTQELGTVVFPIGQLSVGLTRHRALLFKVLADSVGLACRLLRGRAFCDNDDTAAVIVKCGNDKEWVIDLLVEPGTTVPAEKKFSSRPPAIPSPLQFERPFASENVLVHHWTRDGAKPKEGGGGGESPKVKSSSQDWSRPQGSPRISEGGGSEGRLDFAKGGSSRWRPSVEGAKGNYEKKESGDKVKQTDSKAESPVAAKGDFIFEDIARPAVVGGASGKGKSEPSWTEVSKAAIREEQGWPKQSQDSRKSDAPWTQMPGDPLQAPSRDRYDFPKELSPKLPIPWSERVPPKDDRDWPLGVQLESIPKKEPLWTEASRAPSRDEGSGPKPGRDSRKSDAAWREAPRDPLRDDRGWAKDSRKTAGSDESIRSTGTERTVDQLVTVSDFNEFEITWEDVVMGERIGQGSYGMVYRGDWQGSDVAVKVFLDQDLKVEALEEFRSEVALMRRMRHPNIVLFMGAVTKPPNLSIITEFCPRGSLYRLLHRPSRDLDDRKRIRMALDVAKGMNYLHRCQPPVVHRDLKSPNLLVDKNWTVKVCDFGLSRQMHNTFLSCKSGAGTPEWMAPEVLRNEPSDEKSDVYSFGVILWELATLQVPWNGMNPIQVVGAVGFQHRRLAIPDNIDRGIANLIGACWRGETHLRPTFAEIMQELKVLHQRSTQATPRAASTKAEDD